MLTLFAPSTQFCQLDYQTKSHPNNYTNNIWDSEQEEYKVIVRPIVTYAAIWLLLQLAVTKWNTLHTTQ